MRICKECGKEIPKKAYKNKMFCNLTCRTRFNSRNYYSSMKDDLNYKDKKKKYFKKWYKNNYEHFKDLVRVPNKLRARERVKERLKKGLCIYCGKQKPQIKNNRTLRGCERCVNLHREYDRNRYKRENGNV